MPILSIVLQVLLGLGFLMFGFQKFTSEQMKKGFEYFGYSDGFRVFTGFFELASAVIVIVGIWIGSLATIGGIMIVITMFGAIITHIKIKDAVKNMMMPIILLILGAVVVIINWSSLF
ncbi:DoxX family protein [Bacillus norwichensis]|uniref:DoxX family protein n=1 Tax=Bacillus norwichensis TaxID=2762217 RepID=A0ABR8VNS7_9BACI|nr:DoxX family protein [Bacillus norwichensis]MBD8006424.1 DoxX family protein [Bacillus norwichensis]